mgnify:CR=1 FL=1
MYAALAARKSAGAVVITFPALSTNFPAFADRSVEFKNESKEQAIYCEFSENGYITISSEFVNIVNEFEISSLEEKDFETPLKISIGGEVKLYSSKKEALDRFMTYATNYNVMRIMFGGMSGLSYGN